MKRIFCFALFLISVSVSAFAQDVATKRTGDQLYEGSHHYEIGGGINMLGILGSVGGPGREFGPGVYLEYRYALTEHVDVGGQLNFKCGKGHSSYTGPGYPIFDFFCNQAALKALADYNICPTRLASPYIGVGAGAGYMIYKRLDNNELTHYPYGIIGGRIGVQVWRFRLALECDFAVTRLYSFSSTETSTAINLSYTF